MSNPEPQPIPDNLDDLAAGARHGQDQLATDVNELLDRINPKNAFERWKNEAVDSAKGFFVAEDGNPETGHIAAVAGGALGVITLAVALGLRGKSE